MQYIRTVILIFCDCELIPKYSLSKKQQKQTKKTPTDGSNEQGGKAIF